MVHLQRQIFTAEFTHPGRSVGKTYDDYIINHNLGTDIKKVYVSVYNTSLECWNTQPDFDQRVVSSLDYTGWLYYINNQMTVTFRIFLLGTGDVDVRIIIEA